MSNAFNYAMVEWAKQNTIPKDMFNRVIELSLEEFSNIRRLHHANLSQCLSIAFWALGRKKEAMNCLNDAKNSADQTATTFSCWRYMSVSSKEMVEDCNEIEKLINGAKIKPVFFKQLKK